MVILKTREMKVDEGDAKALKTQLVQLKREQFNLRFQAETGQLTSTHQITEVRRDIARLKTRIGYQVFPKRWQRCPRCVIFLP